MVEPEMASQVSSTTTAKSSWDARSVTSLVSILLALLATLLFFRSVLPRIPRLVLRGRLRVRRVGLRGVRGLEWRSNGFPSKFAEATRLSDRMGGAEADAADDGLVIKVQRMHVRFHGVRSRRVEASSSSGESETCQERARKGWITLHVQGIGIRLPKKRVDPKAMEARARAAKQARDEALARRKQMERDQEQRLLTLMRSPIAPPPQPSTSEPSPPSPSPTLITRPSSYYYRTMPILVALVLYDFARLTIFPSIKERCLRLVRATLYLLASSLPALTALVNIEVDRVEVYAEEAEVVLRVGRIDGGFSVAVSSSRGDAPASGQHKSADERCESTLWSRWSEAVTSMPARLESGAKGAAAYVTAALPTGQGSMRWRFEDVQVFETTFTGPRGPAAATVNPQPIRPNGPARPGSAGRGAALMQASASARWLAGSPPPTPGKPTTHRSSSASKLPTMSTVSLSGWTDRWADWALEPDPASNFSADTGWARKLDADARAPGIIPKSARLLSLRGVSSIGATMPLAASFSINRREAVRVFVDIAQTSIGVNAINRTVELLAKSKTEQKRAAEAAGVLELERSETCETQAASGEHEAQIRGAGRLFALLGRLTISLTSVDVVYRSEYSESPSHLPSVPPLRLTGRLDHFRCQLSTSSPSDQLHQHFFGTCGIKKNKSFLPDRLRREGQKRKGDEIEYRRVVQVDMSVGHIEGFCVQERPDGEVASQSPSSTLFRTNSLAVHARTSWTPFGILPGRHATAADIRGGYFASDPNEHATSIDVKLDGVEGEVQVQHLVALLKLSEASKRRKSANAPPSDSQKTRSTPPAAEISRLPRVLLGVTVQNVRYALRVPLSDSQSADSFAPTVHLAIPQFFFSSQGSYSDACVRRPDAERRSGWKDLREDKLMWSCTSKAKPVHSEEQEQPHSEQGQKEGLTMAEALQEMKKLQQLENPGQSREKSPSRPSSKASSSTLFTPPPRRNSQPPCGSSSIEKNCERGKLPVTLQYRIDCAASISTIELYTTQQRDTGVSMSGANTDSHSFDMKVHFFVARALDMRMQGQFPGMQDMGSCVPRLRPREGSLDTQLRIEHLDTELWRKSVVSTLNRTAQLLGSVKAEAASSAPETAPAEGDFLPLIQRLPRCDFHLSLGGSLLHLGGSDKHSDPDHSRGIGLETKQLVLEYALADAKEKYTVLQRDWGARAALDLAEDVRVSASAHATRHGRAAIVKLNLHDVTLFPILDAKAARESDQRKESGGEGAGAESSPPSTPAVFAPAVWDFQHPKGDIVRSERLQKPFKQQDPNNFIFSLPRATFIATIRPPRASKADTGKPQEEIVVTTENIGKLAMKIELLHTYCLLVAFGALRNLVPPKPESGNVDRPAPSKSVSRPPPSININAEVQEVHCSIALPQDVHLFIQIARLSVRVTKVDRVALSWDSLMCAVKRNDLPHEGREAEWDEMARLRDWRISLPRDGGPPLHVHVSGDSATVRVPFDYHVHPIIDNAIVAFKATKQLVYQALTGKTESIIAPHGEDPKHLPQIAVRLRILTIEAQDDPFETRLNIIWRAGGDEQNARQEREAAFEVKAAEIEMEDRRRSKASLGTFASESVDDTDDDSVSFAESGTSTSAASTRQPAATPTHVSVQEARERLCAYNASSWYRRCTNAKAEQARREDVNLRRIYGRYPPSRDAAKLPIKVNPPPKAAPLFRSTMSKISLDVGPTSFPESHLRDFIHEQGGGMPHDTVYSTLVPAHVHWRMAEWRIDVRDYPLPLLHVPPVHRSRSNKDDSWDLEGDIVIAEQLGGEESTRHVHAVVVPAATARPSAMEYGISVPKVAMPVKFYGSPVVRIGTPYATRAVWGQSLQPAIQDIQRVFDSVTSPPQDPSPRIGFWDKLPLIIHGKFLFEFPGGGDLHVYMKGSRDPYQILGHGAGWVKCWRGGVEIRIGFDNNEKELLQIVSDEYLLAIPDLKDYVDDAAAGGYSASKSDESGRRSTGDTNMSAHANRYMKEPDFRKVCLKLTHGVRWGVGLLRERTCRGHDCVSEPRCEGSAFYRECRFFDRKPHWKVITRSEEYMETLPESKRNDSFEGWRTDHLHFSISVFSPREHDHDSDHPDKTVADGVVEKVDSTPSNNFFFTPLAWEHFWAWVRLFSSAMSLPVRQGKLFPSEGQRSPKFGQALGTMKYRFDIAPLFITHVYPQHLNSDWARGTTTLLGVKARMAAFHLDFHQRQQETVKERPQLGESRKILHKPFYEAELDCDQIDLRALGGQFQDPDKRLVPLEDEETDAEDADNFFAGNCTIPERDLEWIDINDFVELDWSPTDNQTPKIKLLQAFVCPKFSFYRHIDSKRERLAKLQASHPEDGPQGDATPRPGEPSEDEDDISGLERSKFGRENTHICLVGKAASAPSVQASLGEARGKFLATQLAELMKDAPAPTVEGRKLAFAEAPEAQTASAQNLRAKIVNIQKRIDMIEEWVKEVRSLDTTHRENAQSPLSFAPVSTTSLDGKVALPALYRDWETFNQRFFVHNPTIFLSNMTRNLLLKYYLSSRQRRGFVHHMTARAVRYIRDMALPKSEKEDRRDNKRTRSTTHTSSTSGGTEGNRLLNGLLDDAVQYVEDLGDEDDKEASGDHSDFLAADQFHPGDGISDQYAIVKSNVCVLLKPQIVLKSDRDDSSTLIITATRSRLQNYAVNDPQCEEDSVNERVMYRNLLALDGIQCFHPSEDCSYLPTAQARGSLVYVPLETLIDVNSEMSDFDRIVPRTDASLQYDKFNRLRLNDSSRPVAAEGNESREMVDHLRHYIDLFKVRCPRFTVSANSEHFGALYDIVTDLVLYSDPTYRENAKRRETMLFSYDFSDPLSLAEVVRVMQLRIRHAQNLQTQYRINFDNLNEDGKLDFLSLKAETLDLIRELTILVEAITSSQSGADKDRNSALRIEARARDIAWNMMGAKHGELLAKLVITRTSFVMLRKADNSTANTLSIMDLQALNVDPDALFTEIISKHYKAPDHPMAEKGQFVNAMWSGLPSVGGIEIVEKFEFDLHPIRLQLEVRVGRQIMDYIFGSQRRREKERDEEEDKKPRTRKKKGPLALIIGGSGGKKAEGNGGASTPRGHGTPRRSMSRDRSSGNVSDSGGRDHRNSRQISRGRAASPSGQLLHSDSSDDENDAITIARKDAATMRQRASQNHSFVYVRLAETTICLSFKGEKQKSITDLYDVVFRAPTLEYRNQTWAYIDLVNHFKKDVVRAAWSQRTSLIKGVFNKPHLSRRNIPGLNARRAAPSSPALEPKAGSGEVGALQLHVEPPTPRGTLLGDSAEAASATEASADTNWLDDDSESEGSEGDEHEGEGEHDGVPSPRAVGSAPPSRLDRLLKKLGKHHASQTNGNTDTTPRHSTERTTDSPEGGGAEEGEGEDDMPPPSHPPRHRSALRPSGRTSPTASVETGSPSSGSSSVRVYFLHDRGERGDDVRPTARSSAEGGSTSGSPSPSPIPSPNLRASLALAGLSDGEKRELLLGGGGGGGAAGGAAGNGRRR